MSTKELVISQPCINMELCYAWAEGKGRESAISFLDDRLKRRGVGSDTHPVVADLCAGSGAIAGLLLKRGWQPNSITCVDRRKILYEIAPGIKWLYWDLEALGQSLRLAEPIPDQLQDYKQSFDLVTLFNGYLGSEIEELICNYLVRPSGVVICASSLIT